MITVGFVYIEMVAWTFRTTKHTQHTMNQSIEEAGTGDVARYHTIVLNEIK